jgi:hypothetical protein
MNQLETREVSILEAPGGSSTAKAEEQVNHAKAADGIIPIEAKIGGQNGGLPQSVAQAKESSDEAPVEKEGASDNNRADQHAT